MGYVWIFEEEGFHSAAGTAHGPSGGRGPLPGGARSAPCGGAGARRGAGGRDFLIWNAIGRHIVVLDEAQLDQKTLTGDYEAKFLLNRSQFLSYFIHLFQKNIFCTTPIVTVLAINANSKTAFGRPNGVSAFVRFNIY